MTSITKISEYLGLADADYLAARMLLLGGLPTVGLSKAAEAMEKQFKLFFLQFERIENGRELDVRDLKGYGHRLREMLESYNGMVPAERRLDDSWKSYLELLEEAYAKRYPEHWEKWEAEVDLGKLDCGYVYLRNANADNFPAELRDRARDFGTFIGDVFRQEAFSKRIALLGLLHPIEYLKLNNESYGDLAIHKNA